MPDALSELAVTLWRGKEGSERILQCSHDTTKEPSEVFTSFLGALKTHGEDKFKRVLTSDVFTVSLTNGYSDKWGACEFDVPGKTIRITVNPSDLKYKAPELEQAFQSHFYQTVHERGY